MRVSIADSKGNGDLDIHFILEALLPLLPSNQGVDEPRALAVLQVDRRRHLCLVSIRQDASLLHEHFSVVTVGITPLEVLVGGLLHVHFYVL